MLPATVPQSSDQAAEAAANQPIHTYLGWEIFLSRVFRERIDKGLWLHWYHPTDRERITQEAAAVCYGHFVAPTQPLEEALQAVYQSIDAIVELESMENDRSLIAWGNALERYRQVLPIAG